MYQLLSEANTTQTTMLKLVVLFFVLALVAANPGVIAPYGLAAPLVAGWGGWGGHYNYRGPLSLAPGQPANILAADGRPLDTLEVNADRAAHYTARAINGAGVHYLKKRSAVLTAPLAVSHVARVDHPARLIVPSAHLAIAPFAYHGGHFGWAPFAAPYAHW